MLPIFGITSTLAWMWLATGSFQGGSTPVRRAKQQFLPSGNPSGNVSPNSSGGGSRSSAISWQGQLPPMISQNGQPYVQGKEQGGYNCVGSGSGGVVTSAVGAAAFWEQVTASTFDWRADPNLPFNI